MAKTLLQGYLLQRKEINSTDEEVFFVTNSKIYKCISLGSKKQTSKNNKNLVYGKLLTIELFLGNKKDSRMVKVKPINDEKDLKLNSTLILLNECTLLLKKDL
jgi:hypothetical protein